jgi:5-methylcytosine-specific restriction endonuclease McrA
VCGVSILSGLNKKTCSRKCSNIYRTGINYKIGRPKDIAKKARSLKVKLLKKRGGICERCGYNNQNILQIHHKNRRRSDNSIENLEILCPNCHYEEHILNKNK